MTGSSQVFQSTVMSLQPVDYYRLGDAAGSGYPADQVNADAWANAQLNGQYNAVGLGTDPNVFNDGTDAAKFTAANGSYVQLPDSLSIDTPESVGLWFKTTGSGPLHCMQNAAIGAGSAPSAATCPLYVGTNGKLYGGWSLGSTSNIGSAHAVNDGNWHYAVLTGTSTGDALYLDGALVGTGTGTFSAAGQIVDYLGAGYSSADWPNEGDKGNWYFTGDLSDAAFFRSSLSQAQVTTLWQGYDNTVGSVVPLETVNVTDPANSVTGKSGVETYAYDPAHGGRVVSYTDALGNRTTYGYDANGYLYSTTDPDGDETITGRDARGNAVSTTTCQYQSQDQCQTSYDTYYWSANGLPADTTDVRADLVVSASDARSTSATQTTYATTTGYDGAGNVLSTTDPDGDKTTSTYTDGTSTFPACDPTSTTLGTRSATLDAPAGLLAKTTTAGGAVTQYAYYPDGDSCEVTNADGLETFYTYDGLGRVLTKTVTGSAVVPSTGMTQYTETLTTTYTYDGDGRVLSTLSPAVTDRVTGAVHTELTTQSFDADGNLLSSTVSDTTGGDYSRTTSYAYNGYDQKISETAPEGNASTNDTGAKIAANSDGQNHVTTYTYDLFGNVETTTDPEGRATETLYDGDNRLVTTEMLNTNTDGTEKAGATLVTDTRTYDPAGRLAEETDADGYATCYLYYDDNLTYESIQLSTSATACPASAAAASAAVAKGVAFVNAQDTYDGAGNLLTTVTNNGETTTTYAYDDAGRKTTTTVDPSGVDRITTYSYTPDGYVKETKVQGPGTSGTVVSDVTDTYDPMGEGLTQTVVDGSTSLVTTTVLDERGLPAQSTDPDGATTYTTYDEAGRLVITQSPQLTSTTYSTSTMSADTTSAYAISTIGYDTFGEVVESEAPDSPDAGSTGSGATADSTVNTYDADGNETSSTAPSYTAPGARLRHSPRPSPSTTATTSRSPRSTRSPTTPTWPPEAPRSAPAWWPR